VNPDTFDGILSGYVDAVNMLAGRVEEMGKFEH
jgi:hypothetical protein